MGRVYKCDCKKKAIKLFFPGDNKAKWCCKKRKCKYTKWCRPERCDCLRPLKKFTHANKEEKHSCRYFGSFSCPTCKNKWVSAYAWYNATQKCYKCKKDVNPKYFEQLKGGGHSKISGRHHECSQCREFGQPCDRVDSTKHR